VLAAINLSPWIIAIAYDLILYACRTIWYEFPVYGGRARGNRRPRAPSIRERPRRMSFADLIRVNSGASIEGAENVRQRRQQHKRELSAESIEEE
jgi:hypothetical protein